MKLSEVKNKLSKIETLSFKLPNGSAVPGHFHVTEIGLVTKKFIDCGGTLRNEDVINFQLWSANDYDHRLHPDKLLNIINLAEDKLDLTDSEIEVEYQAETIGKFGLEFENNEFVLTSKHTNCLALDSCGIPVEKTKKALADLQNESSCCSPESGCC